jgi:hypothetical protein
MDGALMITRHMFVQATGRQPHDDDLDRCNCEKTGEVGHFWCGWDDAQEMPRFMTARPIVRVVARREVAT